jgi:hypothetical protein
MDGDHGGATHISSFKWAASDSCCELLKAWTEEEGMATQTNGLLPDGWLSVGKSFLAVLHWGATSTSSNYLPTPCPWNSTVMGYRGLVWWCGSPVCLCCNIVYPNHCSLVLLAIIVSAWTLRCHSVWIIEASDFTVSPVLGDVSGSGSIWSLLGGLKLCDGEGAVLL